MYSDEIIGGDVFIGDNILSKRYPNIAKRYKRKQPLDVVLSSKLVYFCLIRPVEKEHGQIIRTSWWRPQTLNDAVNGSWFSDHLSGIALDFKPAEAGILDVFNWIYENEEIDYRQLIIYPNKDHTKEFIHCALNHPNKNRKREAWYYLKGKYYPFNGEKIFKFSNKGWYRKDNVFK